MKKIILSLALMALTVCVQAQVTAKGWNARVKAGWNLGNSLECAPVGWDGESVQIGSVPGGDNAETAWGNPVVTKKMIKAVKAAGFNAIRVPVRWGCHIKNADSMTIEESWLARVKEVIDYALSLDMQVILNTHHEKWLESQPYKKTQEYNNQKLMLLWFNIATAFQNYDDRLAFAGTNEIHEKDVWGKPTAENLEVQNSYNQTFVYAVRATGGNNMKRHLIVQTYVCNPDFGINGEFIVPEDPDNGNTDYLSVEFHFYNPWDYAGLGKDYYYWGDAYKQYGKTPESNEKTMTDFFDRVVKTWSDRGLGIVIGEWGVTDHYKGGEADRIHENMQYYCRFLVSEARKRGFSTFVWDNNQFGSGPEKYGIFDRHKGMKIVTPWVVNGIAEALAE